MTGLGSIQLRCVIAGGVGRMRAGIEEVHLRPLSVARAGMSVFNSVTDVGPTFIATSHHLWLLSFLVESS